MTGLTSRSPHLLVVGDLILDHYVSGSCHRISSEAPIPIVDVEDENLVPGGAANVMHNLCTLGAKVTGMSVVGDDQTGEEIVGMLTRRGVNTSAIATQPGRVSPRKTRVVAGNQQIVRFDNETRSPICDISATNLLRAIERQAAQFELILLSDYGKGVLTDSLTSDIIRIANRHQTPVLVDPTGNRPEKYRGATLVTPNKKEATRLTNIPIDDDDSLYQAGESLRSSLEAPYAVITLSEEGMALFDGSMTRIRSVAKDVYDVSGAGDTVLATLGFCMACGLSVGESAQMANQAAGVAVAKRGVSTVSWNEIFAEDLEFPKSASSHVKTVTEIAQIANQLRREGKRIVFTNGCFDLLHRGHVEYLKASRAYGDVLIVGVNSDQSVRNTKGPHRPIVPEEDRAGIMAALPFVDHIVVFDEDTPLNLIKRIRPDVLTKGADYYGKKIVGSELVDEVHLIALVDGRSTTSTIERVRRAA